MAKPLIHFPMDEDELLDLITVLKGEVHALQHHEGDAAEKRRGKLLLLQIRLSATYKELSEMTCNKN